MLQGARNTLSCREAHLIVDSVSCGRSKIGDEYLNNVAQGQPV